MLADGSRRERDERGRYMAGERIRYDGSDTGYPQFRPYQPGERGFKHEGEFGNIPREMRRGDRYAGMYDGGNMGFGANDYDAPYGHSGKHSIPDFRAGGTFWMDGGEARPLDRVTAERWVKSMKNADKRHPQGGKWSIEEVKPFIRKLGMPADEETLVEFYAAMNAMYSDFGEVCEAFGVNTAEYYACLAKAWLEDEDAVEDKAAMYYHCIVKHD